MVTATRVASIKKYFARLKDPRVRNRTKHRLIDIMAIALCGVIANCDTWAEIVDFGNTHVDWLKRFLKLPGGIPSQDTFERVFAKIHPAAFSSCCVNWLRSVSDLLGVAHIAIDGKTLRGSASSTLGPLHLVSAWATEAKLTLGEVAVEGKSNDSSSGYPFQKRNCWTLPSRSCLNWARVFGVSGNRYSFQVRCFLTWIVPLWMRSCNQCGGTFRRLAICGTVR